MIRDMNGVPWSVKISSGMPTRENIRTNSRAIPFEAMVRSGMASGYLVA